MKRTLGRFFARVSGVLKRVWRWCFPTQAGRTEVQLTPPRPDEPKPAVTREVIDLEFEEIRAALAAEPSVNAAAPEAPRRVPPRPIDTLRFGEPPGVRLDAAPEVTKVDVAPTAEATRVDIAPPVETTRVDVPLPSPPAELSKPEEPVVGEPSYRTPKYGRDVKASKPKLAAPRPTPVAAPVNAKSEKPAPLAEPNKPLEDKAVADLIARVDMFMNMGDVPPPKVSAEAVNPELLIEGPTVREQVVAQMIAERLMEPAGSEELEMAEAEEIVAPADAEEPAVVGAPVAEMAAELGEMAAAVDEPPRSDVASVTPVLVEDAPTVAEEPVVDVPAGEEAPVLDVAPAVAVEELLSAEEPVVEIAAAVGEEPVVEAPAEEGAFVTSDADDAAVWANAVVDVAPEQYGEEPFTASMRCDGLEAELPSEDALASPQVEAPESQADIAEPESAATLASFEQELVAEAGEPTSIGEVEPSVAAVMAAEDAWVAPDAPMTVEETASSEAAEEASLVAEAAEAPVQEVGASAVEATAGAAVTAPDAIVVEPVALEAVLQAADEEQQVVEPAVAEMPVLDEPLVEDDISEELVASTTETGDAEIDAELAAAMAQAEVANTAFATTHPEAVEEAAPQASDDDERIEDEPWSPPPVMADPYYEYDMTAEVAEAGAEIDASAAASVGVDASNGSAGPWTEGSEPMELSATSLGVTAGSEAEAAEVGGAEATGEAEAREAEATGEAEARETEATGEAEAREAEATGEAEARGAEATGEAEAREAEATGEAEAEEAEATEEAAAGDAQAMGEAEEPLGADLFATAEPPAVGEPLLSEVIAMAGDEPLPPEVAAMAREGEPADEAGSDEVLSFTDDATLDAVADAVEQTLAAAETFDAAAEAVAEMPSDADARAAAAMADMAASATADIEDEEAPIGPPPPAFRNPIPKVETPTDYVATAESMHALYQLQLGGFEGPLDLLLHLIKRHHVDIFDIPIAFICERYLEYLKVMEDLDIDVASEFLFMASELLHLKSRMLLPRPEGETTEEEEVDPRAELVRRLLEYQKYKDVAERFGLLDRFGRDTFGREAEPAPPLEGEAPLKEVGLFALVKAFQGVLDRQKPEVRHQVMLEQVSVRQRIRVLVQRFESQEPTRFDKLLEDAHRRIDIVVTFLALLEMGKLKLLRIFQDEDGVIFVHPKFDDVSLAFARLEGLDESQYAG